MVDELPYDEPSFDAWRIDMLLQHIVEPRSAIDEMARVLHPGGTLVAFDSDWIGRRMRALFLDAGLVSSDDAGRWKAELRNADAAGASSPPTRVSSSRETAPATRTEGLLR